MKVRNSYVLAWLRRRRKISPVPGVFRLLDFAALRPVISWYGWYGRNNCCLASSLINSLWIVVLDSVFIIFYLKLMPFISLVFQFFFGRGELRITETVDTESVDMGARVYICLGLNNYNINIQVIFCVFLPFFYPFLFFCLCLSLLFSFVYLNSPSWNESLESPKYEVYR
jgi:prepilin signal peptidase PulO-like enzyme (type II secretory pathway)